MTQWRWHLDVLAVRHGLWLLPALALLLCAAAAWLVWLPGEQSRMAQTRLALSAQRAEVATARVGAPARHLPGPRAASDSVQRLFALARQYGLNIAQADYRQQDSGAAGRWQVQVPATCSYPQLRYFLRAAQAIPGLSLDELSVQRSGGAGEGRDGAAIEARMLFSIWYDGAGAVP